MLYHLAATALAQTPDPVAAGQKVAEVAATHGVVGLLSVALVSVILGAAAFITVLWRSLNAERAGRMADMQKAHDAMLEVLKGTAIKDAENATTLDHLTSAVERISLRLDELARRAA